MYCPNCGKEYLDGQNFCRYCGYDLNENKVAVKICTSNKINGTSETMSENDFKESFSTEVQNSSVVQELNQDIKDKSGDILKQEEQQQNAPEKKLINNKKYISPKAIAIFTIIIACVTFTSSLLWSIDEETQIQPSATEEYNENFEINTPTDDDNNIYAKEPVNIDRERAIPQEPPVIETQANQTESTQQDDFSHSELEESTFNNSEIINNTSTPIETEPAESEITE